MDNSFNNSGEGTITREQLVQEMKSLVRDAEELVKATAGSVAEKSREELHHALNRLKASSQRIEQRVLESVEATDVLIRDHPYQAIGIAFGVGLLVGVIANR